MPCLLCLFRGAGGPEFGKTCLYNTCTLSNARLTDISLSYHVLSSINLIFLFSIHTSCDQHKYLWREIAPFWPVMEQERIIGASITELEKTSYKIRKIFTKLNYI